MQIMLEKQQSEINVLHSQAKTGAHLWHSVVSISSLWTNNER